MNYNNLYSIRMRASIGDRHVSGGERIVIREKIERTVEELVERAMRKGCTRDQVTVTLEPLRDALMHRLTALDVITLSAPDVQAGRNVASRVLLARRSISAGCSYGDQPSQRRRGPLRREHAWSHDHRCTNGRSA